MLKLFLRHVVAECAISTIAEQIGVNLAPRKMIKSVYMNRQSYTVGTEFVYKRMTPSRTHRRRISKIIEIQYEGKLAFEMYDENNYLMVTIIPNIDIPFKVIYM